MGRYELDQCRGDPAGRHGRKWKNQASVYPRDVTKIEKKGRTKAELQQVIEWLTGFDEQKIQQLIEEEATLEQFFQAATLHPNTNLITGMICGCRVEEIENPLTRQVRFLDKLVDELVKSRPMNKILRGSGKEG